MAGSEFGTSALYALSLSEFTGARNELAKQARAHGAADESERIKRLQKPTLPAWALNMLPRLRERELRELLRAGEQAEAAQAGALAGTGDALQLREASEQLRAEARTLAGEAAEILVKGGHAAREETLLRIARALETCAVTAEGRQRLLKGEFEEEPEATGFDLFAQISAAPAGKRSNSAARKAAKQSSQQAARRQAVEGARADLQERNAERAQAEAETRAAERKARAKQREAEQARQLVERNRKRAARAHEAELEAKKRLDEAKQRLRDLK